MLGVSFLVFAAAVCSAPVSAKPSQPSAPAATPAPAAQPAAKRLDPNRRVCRTMAVTGSRLGKSKVCRTAREWADAEAANKQSTRDLQRPSGLNSSK